MVDARGITGMSGTGGEAEPLPIGLALQGGGSHGAFGWGVLDALLDRDDVAIRAVSGTSAGAVNGFVLAHGWLQSGRAGAKAWLAQLWAAVAEAQARATFGLFDRRRWGLGGDDPSLDKNPFFRVGDLLSQLVSPYQLGPGRHPLELVFAADPRFSGLVTVDAEAVARAGGPRVFVTATDVQTGQARVFGGVITRPQVMASACLPHQTRAVRIDGRFYWDGGYAANPALQPLFEDAATRDVLIVQVNPVDKADEPDTAREIINRMNEIGFNSSLLWQTRGIERLNDLDRTVEALVAAVRAASGLDEGAKAALFAQVRQALAEHVAARNAVAAKVGRKPLDLLLPESLTAALGRDDAPPLPLTERPLHRVAVHMIDADGPNDQGIERFGATSKLNASAWFLEELRAMGRAKAETWLKETLPIIRETRARGRVLSTFWRESGGG